MGVQIFAAIWVISGAWSNFKMKVRFFLREPIEKQ